VSDDHSTEDIKSVCDGFKNWLDIEYIRTHKNMGCGGNRRFALEYFYQNPTDYLMFMDSDDALMPQAIDRLEMAIREDEADIIATDILKESAAPIPEVILAKDSRTWLHGKVYRSQFLIEHNINFPQDIATNEDLAFNLSLYAFKPEVYLLSESLYLWRSNENSVTRSKNETARQQSCRSIDYIMAIYYAYGFYTEDNLTPQMIANILNCYTYWQNGIIFGTLKEKHKQIMRKMLHHPKVSSVMVSIYAHPEIDLKLAQWVVKGDNLMFYG
jgi:glycosyltransferase involved in cell wall biosynthesis